MPAFFHRCAVYLLGAALLGCGESDDVRTDGGVVVRPDGGPDAGAAGCEPGTVTLGDGSCRPAGIPADACGQGFEPTGDGGCRAVLPTRPCPAGQMAIPGETACREVMPCPAGTWGDPDDPDTQFVDATYAGGQSDGSQAAPWTTVQAAVDAAGANAIVSVAAGTYSEDLVIGGKSVRIHGTCPSAVGIVGTSAAQAAVYIDKGASGTELSGLHIVGPAIGVLVTGSEDVVIDRSWIEKTTSRGIDIEDAAGPTAVTVQASLLEATTDAAILMFGSDLTLVDSVVRGTKPIGGSYGRGVDIEPGMASHARSTATIRASVVESSHEAGIFVGGSDATIETTVVRDTLQAGATQDAGYAVWVQQVAAAKERGQAAIKQSVLERSTEASLSIAGSDVTVEATVVRDTLGLETDPLTGIGVIAIDKSGERSTLALRSSLVEKSMLGGVYVLGSDGEVEATIVRDIQGGGPANPSGGRGIGVESEPGGERGVLAVRSSLVERAHDMGIGVLGSEATIQDTLVRDMEPQLSDKKFGRGINAQVYKDDPGIPSKVTIQRCRVERAYEGGIVLLAAEGDIDSTTVIDTRPRLADQAGGRGLILQGIFGTPYLATATVRSSTFQGSFDSGISVAAGTLVLEDSQVTGTQPRQSDGDSGDGVAVQQVLQEGSSITIRRSLIQGSARAAVSNFSGTVGIADTVLDCNKLDLDGEALGGVPFAYSDDGGNACACGKNVRECKVLSASLGPPEPLDSP